MFTRHIYFHHYLLQLGGKECLLKPLAAESLTNAEASRVIQEFYHQKINPVDSQLLNKKKERKGNLSHFAASNTQQLNATEAGQVIALSGGAHRPLHSIHFFSLIICVNQLLTSSSQPPIPSDYTSCLLYHLDKLQTLLHNSITIHLVVLQAINRDDWSAAQSKNFFIKHRGNRTNVSSVFGWGWHMLQKNPQK